MNPDINHYVIDLFEKAINDVWITEVYRDTGIMPNIKRYSDHKDGWYLVFEYTIFSDSSMTLNDIAKNRETLEFFHKHEDYVKNLFGLDFFDLANFNIEMNNKNTLPEVNAVNVEFLYYLTQEKVDLIRFLCKLKGYHTYSEDFMVTSSMFENCTNLKTVSFSSLSKVSI